jgi:hypothetical protein
MAIPYSSLLRKSADTNFRVDPAILRLWVRRRLRLETTLARLMPKLPLNVAPSIISGNCAKCRRSVDDWWPNITPPRPAIGPAHGDNAMPCPNIHHGAMNHTRRNELESKGGFMANFAPRCLYFGNRRPSDGARAILDVELNDQGIAALAPPVASP